MNRRPARETITFALALVAIATLGGVAAASVASAAPAGASGSNLMDIPADVNEARAAPNGSIDYDSERLVVEEAPAQRISGTTTLANGSQITVRVRSTDSENPFIRQTLVTVDEDGSFAAIVDFEQIERGTEFTVSVRYNGTELATAPGVVGECDPACDESGGGARFDQNLWQANAGDSVELTVEFTDRDSAFVRFGADDTGVTIPFTVTDGNGDGTVTVVLETNVDDPNDPGVSAVGSADSVRVHENVQRPQTLEAADYDVPLYPNADASQSDGYDVAKVVLNEPIDDPATTRGGDSTTAGTVYGSASTSTPGGNGGVSTATMGVLAVGGVLAIIGVVALVGGLD